MRVIAGELGGRRLAAPARRGGAVRPTSDRARESLFAILGDLAGLTVLDLFCGTGALAIEALSRGARSAVLVDTDPRLARRNVEALGLGERARVLRAEALAWLHRTDERFDLVFCDPPYGLAPELERELGPALAAGLAPGGRVVLESAARRPLELDLTLEAERRFGEALIRIWRR